MISLTRNILEQVNSQKQKAYWWLPGAEERGTGERMLNGYGFSVGGDENVKLVKDSSYTIL